MSSIEKISRRRFLELTGVAGGSLILMGSLPADAIADVMD